MEKLFKEISLEENGSYKIIYENSYSPFVMSPFTRKVDGVQIKSINLEIPYRNNLIQVVYKLADNHFAILTCNLKVNNKLPAFQVTNRSHYARIFNKKKNILKVACKDSDFTKFIVRKFDSLGIEEIARNFQFEPSIVGDKIAGNYEIKTTFHLAFQEKKNILRPLIKFYKSLIDFSIL